MKNLRKAAAARKIARLSEEKVEKVLAFMDKMETQRAGNTKNRLAPNERRGNGMRKIALRGMIGRKRDTLLLWTVIVLAFLFLALPTTLITSLSATDAAQREQTYGKWQVMASGLSEAGAEELASLAETSAVTPVIEVSGADYFQGDNTYTLGVYSPELAELGSFQLREGRWPEAEDEVVLEYARLASLGLEVGDTFKVQNEAVLHANADYLAELVVKRAEANEAAWQEEYNDLMSRCMDIFLTGDWEIYNAYSDIAEGYGYIPNVQALRVGDWELYTNGNCQMIGTFFDPILGFPPDTALIFYDLWCWDFTIHNADYTVRLRAHPGEATAEQFAELLDIYLNEDWRQSYYFDGSDPVHTGDLLGLEGLSMRLDFSDDVLSGNTDMTLYTYGDYTVCGVIDTFTDHWDSGRAGLPGGFLSQAGYQRLLDARRTVLDKYPQYEDTEYKGLALLRDAGESAGELRARVLPEYDAALTAGNAENWLTANFQIYRESGTVTLTDADGQEWTRTAIWEQINFDFYLADAENGRLVPARAWLVPDTDNIWAYGGYNYYTDGPVDRIEGAAPDTDEQIYLSDLAEREEDTLYVPVGDRFHHPETYQLLIDLDTAMVALDWAGERYEIPFADFMSAGFQVAGMRPTTSSHAFSGTQDSFTGLRANTLAYPSSAEGSGGLLMIVLGMLFVTTVCAVFQICFTQIRRRMRRVVLMKSLGAETKQIAGMMVWEFLYFWVTALPTGTALGLGGAYLATTILSKTQERTVLLTIEPAVLLLALLAGTLALAIGMMIPAIMAVGVPLTGRTVRRKPLAPPKKDVRQDFLHVSLRGLAAKKGRTIGAFALCAFMMTITVLCLFLGFRFLGEYRDTVIRDGKPDYLLRSSYAMSTRQRAEYLEELEELGVCGSVTSYLVGEDIGLGGESLEESFLFTIAAGDGESCPVDLYTLTSGDPLFADFQSAATVGSLDAEAFDSGKQVLLAVPLYRDTGRVNEAVLAAAEGWDRVAASGVETTFLPEYDGVFQRDEAVQVGDAIRLERVATNIVDEGNASYYIALENTAEVTVGAILYYFPDTGIWPLSGSGEGYQIVAAPSLLKKMLPGSCTTLQDQNVRALYLQQNSFSKLDGVYGSTDFYITAAEGVEKETADTALLIFARNHYMDIEVYHESSTALLRNAVSNILLACLLGMSAVLLALVIFYNTVSSDIEQERPRIGILQSLGVSNGRFAARQAAVGAAASAIAVVVANVLLWGGVILFVCATGTVLGNLLWGYPAAWHVCLCAVLACILISLFVLPMSRVGRYLPVENIRSKN